MEQGFQIHESIETKDDIRLLNGIERSTSNTSVPSRVPVNEMFFFSFFLVVDRGGQKVKMRPQVNKDSKRVMVWDSGDE